MTQLSSHSPEMQQEAVYGGAQHVSVSSSFALRLLAVAVNVLVLAEVCVAMYFGSQDMDNITPVFFFFFFILLIPTIFCTIFMWRILSSSLRKSESQ